MNGKEEDKIFSIGMRMCNVCLEIAKPGTVDKSLIGKHSRKDLLKLLANDLDILTSIFAKKCRGTGG